jgi:CSLREA domain-containing protein
MKRTLRLRLTRGLLRIAAVGLLGGAVLIGKPERVTAANWTVDTLLDEQDSSCSDGDCSLRDAIGEASDGDVIDFAVSGTITLTIDDLHVDKALTFNGPGSDRLTISADGLSSVFTIGSAKDVTLEGLALTKGHRGIYNHLGNVTVSNCAIHDNIGSGNGGGIYNDANLVLTNSTLSGNHARAGGGIYNDYGVIAITNSTVSGNWTDPDEHGGGIYNAGTLTLTNVTVTNNHAGGDGGGIYEESRETTYLKNTILEGNTASNQGPDCFGGAGQIVSLGYNLLGDTSSCTVDGDTATMLFNLNPMLGPLALNPPGSTATHALLTKSPAIDAIPPLSCTILTDQRGIDRPQSTACDIGAYEYMPPIVGGTTVAGNVPVSVFASVAGAILLLLAAIGAARRTVPKRPEIS